MHNNFNFLFIYFMFRAINAGKTPHRNEDQSVAGMFCLNVCKSSSETDGGGSPRHVTQVKTQQQELSSILGIGSITSCCSGNEPPKTTPKETVGIEPILGTVYSCGMVVCWESSD